MARRHRLLLLLGLATLVAQVGVARAGASAGPVSIMALGDSITYGVSGPAVNTPGGYRGPLATYLSQSGLAFAYAGSSEENAPLRADPARYRHEGHPGFRIDQVAHDLVAPDSYPGTDGGYWMRGPSGPTDRPKIVILHIGTNDLSQGYDPYGHYPGGYNENDASERSQFVQHTITRLGQLLGEINSLDPGVRIVLCTITPMGVATPDPADRQYDQAIRQQLVPAAAQQGWRVVLADVEAAFLASPTYHDLIGPDGVHPTPLGYQTMASVIAPAVLKALQRWPT